MTDAAVRDKILELFKKERRNLIQNLMNHTF